MWTSIKMLLWLTFIAGAVYPLLISLVAQLVFAPSANGGVIIKDGKAVGAELIGQSFQSENYFWGRPSHSHYDPLKSGGSNLGPTSAELKTLFDQRQSHLAEAHQVNPADVPKELLFASGSGLDPHISPKAASFQVDRILKARNLDLSKDKETVSELIKQNTHFSSFHPLGKPSVNVLLLNLSLDQQFPLNKTRVANADIRQHRLAQD